MRNLSSILLQFNEALDASTINSTNVVVWEDTNGDGIQDGGETVLTVSRQYDGPKWAIFLGLQQILTQNKKYCSKITTGVKDVVGNAATAATKCFTTVDATFTASAPTVMFADADTFNVWIEFDMPVDFTTGPFGALNKQNYAIENPVGTSLNLNDATFSAREIASGVTCC